MANISDRAYEQLKSIQANYLRPETLPLWQDSWHYLIFNQLGGSGVDSPGLAVLHRSG